jgi:hypothetical protein
LDLEAAAMANLWLANEICNQSPVCRPGRGREASYGARSGHRTYQDDRIYIEKVNGPFLFGDKGVRV